MQQSTKNPEFHYLHWFRWQFFGTLTFRRDRMPERVRLTMWFTWVRMTCELFKIYFPKSIWVLRAELGETFGRQHFHFLIGGLPDWATTEKTCVILNQIAKKAKFGITDVRLYNPDLAGLGYIADCLKVREMDNYESSKFGSGSSNLMLSHELQRYLESKRKMGPAGSRIKRPVQG